MRSPIDGMADTVLGAMAPQAAHREDLPRGLALTLWSGQGLLHALEHSRTLLTEARPQMVQLHAGPRGMIDHAARAAANVRHMVPGVTLLAGIAWDGWIEDYDRATARKQVEIEALYLEAAISAHREGVKLLVINSEAAGKQHPAAARKLGARLIDAIRTACPGMALGHTAYDHPHYHPEERSAGGRIDADDEGYPWSVYLGGARAVAVEGLVLPTSGRVDVSMEQVYAAPAKGDDGVQPMAGLGALGARMEGSRKSFDRAEALGWIDPDVLHWPYWQGHHVPAPSAVGLGARLPRVAVWASPTRLDADGQTAVRVLAAGYAGRLDLAGAPLHVAAVRAWAQGRLGIDAGTAWGTWGPKSRAACSAFQAVHALSSTGELDAATLAALGAP